MLTPALRAAALIFLMCDNFILIVSRSNGVPFFLVIATTPFILKGSA
jgi:hypothetical protein